MTWIYCEYVKPPPCPVYRSLSVCLSVSLTVSQCLTCLSFLAPGSTRFTCVVNRSPHVSESNILIHVLSPSSFPSSFPSSSPSSSPSSFFLRYTCPQKYVERLYIHIQCVGTFERLYIHIQCVGTFERLYIHIQCVGTTHIHTEK